GFSTLIAECGGRAAYRRAVLVFLAALFLWAPTASRPPALPLAVSYEHSPIRDLAALGDALRKAIPSDSRIFNVGATQALYIAGLKPYLRQTFGFNTLSPMTEDRVRARSGLWAEPEIRAWLANDADYAVIVPASLDGYRVTCPTCMDLAESLLAQHFDEIAVLDNYPERTHVVYKRRSVSIPRRS